MNGPLLSGAAPQLAFASEEAKKVSQPLRPRPSPVKNVGDSFALTLNPTTKYNRCVNFDQRIAGLRSQIQALDSQIDENQAPYLKARIRFAGHCLDDAESIMRHVEKDASPLDLGSFRAFAEHSISCAAGIYLTCTAIVKDYGPQLKEY